MPVIDVDPDELRHLAGVTDRDDESLLDELFALGLEFEGETEDGKFQLEFAPDRLDRLSVEGVARSLRYQDGTDRGIHLPTVNPPTWTIEVDESVPAERPAIAGAIVRNVSLDETTLASLIQLQEKLHDTMGRRRVKGAIGIHDLTMLKGAAATNESAASITYRGIQPDEDRFVPLDADQEMTPGDVLVDHPTGRDYASIVEEYDAMPAIYDELGLFSFPPVINGRRTEVTVDSTDLLIELTGTDQWTIDKMLAIICYAFDARGATLEAVTIEYPEMAIERPDLSTDTKRLEHSRIERTMGIDLAGDAVIDLLERSGLDAEAHEGDDGLVYDVEIPPYRVDVLHPVDLVDDIGRAYGFNDLEPRYPDIGTVGDRHEDSRFERAVRGVLAGLGFEDLLNFNLISEADNFDRMGISPTDNSVGAHQPPRIREPYSEEYEIVRTWALPSLFMVLENNTHRRYPQHLSEIGVATAVDETTNTGVAEWRTVAGVLAGADASYESAKSAIQGLARRFDVPVETPRTDHPSFIDGRTGAISFTGEPVGVIGEVHPSILVEHDLEVPVAAFEFRLEGLANAVEEVER